MKSRRFLSIVMLACVALATVAVAAIRSVVTFACEVGMRAKSWLLDAVSIVAGTDAEQPKVAVLMVQAKAFMQRLVKRDRPVVTASWRMCPSI